MPSTTSSSVSSDLASSTVITPSLPTFFIASARKRPISRSPFAEIVPTWAISSFEVTFFEFFYDRFDGKVDAALEIHRIHAGGDRLGAFLDDRGSEHGGGGGAVAGDVGGLRRHLAHHLRAHILELVLELDLLRHGHPVLGDVRRAERLLEDDVAAAGPERDGHRIGQDVHAA